MLIDCPACARSYHVDRADIEGGRTVICPRCDARWDVDPDGFKPTPPHLDNDALAGWVNPIPRPPAPAGRRLLPRLPWSVTVGIIGIALMLVAIEARAHVVRFVPRTAALYAAAGLPVNLRGLEFRNIEPRRTDPASPEVTVSGEIRNVAHRRVRVPRLVFEVRDAAGAPLVRWSEKAPASLVGAGKVLAFASTPHAIPSASRTVLVGFEEDPAS